MGSRPKSDGRTVIALTFGGLFPGSTGSRRRRGPWVAAQSPLQGLSARQAITAAAVGNIVGTVAMALFVSY